MQNNIFEFFHKNYKTVVSMATVTFKIGDILKLENNVGVPQILFRKMIPLSKLN